MDTNKPSLEELKNIARMREKLRGETGTGSMPVKTIGSLTAEAPSTIQKTSSGEVWMDKIRRLQEDYKAKKEGLTSAKSPEQLKMDIETLKNAGKISDENAAFLTKQLEESKKLDLPSNKPFGLSSIPRSAVKAIPAINVLSLPVNAINAQKEIPDTDPEAATKRGAIMMGLPKEMLPKTEQDYFEELKKRMGVDQPA